MREPSSSFVPLLLVLLLALVVPLLISRFKRLSLPIVVGEILAGVVVGRSGFGWVTNGDEMLTLLSELGFVFLMFLAGMEIDFSNLSTSNGKGNRAHQSNNQFVGPISLSIITFLFTLTLSVAVGFGLFWMGLVRDSWMMALILSTTSLGVVMPVLKETGLTSGRFGQTMLISALVADFATMLLITIEVAALSHGLTLDILLFSFLFVVFFLLYRLGLFSLNQVSIVRRTLEELSHTTARIKIRGAFTLMLLFVALSELLGVEVILGAFMAGAMLSLLSTPQDTEAMHQLEAVGFGFFIPIFFIMVGVDFNLAALLGSSEALLLLPLLLLAAIAVKMGPLLLYRMNFSWRETLSAGVLLSSRLSLIIAASAIGLRLGIIGESVNAAVILVAIISVTVAPLVFQRMAPEASADGSPPIVVFGAGELGLLVAEQLRNHHEHVVVMDSDPERVARANQRSLQGVKALQADVNDYSEEAAACLDAAHAVVITYSDTDLNRRVCHMVRSQYGIDHIVSLVTNPNVLDEFERLNVTVVNPALDQASLLTLLARNPTVYELLTRAHEDKEVSEVEVRTDEHVGRSLRQLALPGDVLVLALRRHDEFLVPRGNTALEAGDRLTLVGSLDHLDQARRMFEHQDGYA